MLRFKGPLSWRGVPLPLPPTQRVPGGRGHPGDGNTGGAGTAKPMAAPGGCGYSGRGWLLSHIGPRGWGRGRDSGAQRMAVPDGWRHQWHSGTQGTAVPRDGVPLVQPQMGPPIPTPALFPVVLPCSVPTAPCPSDPHGPQHAMSSLPMATLVPIALCPHGPRDLSSPLVHTVPMTPRPLLVPPVLCAPQSPYPPPPSPLPPAPPAALQLGCQRGREGCRCPQPRRAVPYTLS